MSYTSFDLNIPPSLNYTMHSTYEKSSNGCITCTVVRMAIANNPIHREELGWWIEVFTAHPACMYYFGVFENVTTAEEAMTGFVDDLISEGSKGMVSRVCFHRPIELTLDLEQSRMAHFPPGVDIL
jgi:hypothetical protein